MKDKVTHSAFSGMLAEDSPLRGVFKNGIVPLKSPFGQAAELGEGKNVQTCEVNFIVLAACTSEQKEGMAQLMVRLGQCSIEEARKVVALEETMPIRMKNLVGVSFPLSFVI
jgi:hypothetical protein